MEIQISYAIGVAQPVLIFVDTFCTGKVSDYKISKWVLETFDLRPMAIIERLSLRRAIYASIAAYGHFGNQNEKTLGNYLMKV